MSVRSRRFNWIRRRAWLGWQNETGSAAVEFVLVLPIVLFCFVAVAQVILVAHVRATLVSAAAEGARAGANANASSAVAVKRTRIALDSSAVGSSAESINSRNTVVHGNPVVQVTIQAKLPLIGLLGPSSLEVEGHALREV